MTDYTNPHAATGTYEPPEEIFDDYGKPVTEDERPFYRPEKNENKNPNPIRPDQGDDIASIIDEAEDGVF